MKQKSIFFSLVLFTFAVLGGFGIALPNLNFTNAASSQSSTWDGTTPETAPTEGYKEDGNKIYIRSASGFAYFASNVNKDNGSLSYSGKTIYLQTDIDLDGKDFTPIGSSSKPFQGIFQGMGHTIYNLSVNNTNNSSINTFGLFGAISNSAEISNLHISNLFINYQEQSQNAESVYIGGIVGMIMANSVRLLDCSVNGVISANIVNGNNNYIGGIAGYMQEATLSHVNSLVEIRITSLKNEQVTSIENKSQDNSKFNYVGGIAGYANKLIVLKSYNSGSIYVGDSSIEEGRNPHVFLHNVALGGLFGVINESELSICYNVGEITTRMKNVEYVGGLIGVVEASSTKLYLNQLYNAANFNTDETSLLFSWGGIIGKLNMEFSKLTIKDIFNIGKVKLAGDFINIRESGEGVDDKFSNLINPKVDSYGDSKIYYNSNGISNTDNNALFNLDAKAKIRGFYSSEYWSKPWGIGENGNWNFSSSVNNSLPYINSYIDDQISNNDQQVFNQINYYNNLGIMGDGSFKNPFKIRTAGDLNAIATYYYLPGYVTPTKRLYYSLQNDINLQGRTWKPIGVTFSADSILADGSTAGQDGILDRYFTGVFDGNNHTISGMVCSLQEDMQYSSLFGVVKNAVIKNLKIKDFVLRHSKDPSKLGTFIGEASTDIDSSTDKNVNKIDSGVFLINCADISEHVNYEAVAKITVASEFYVAYGLNNIDRNLGNTINYGSLKITRVNSFNKFYESFVNPNSGYYYNIDKKSTLEENFLKNTVTGGYHTIVKCVGSDKKWVSVDLSMLDKTYVNAFLPGDNLDYEIVELSSESSISIIRPNYKLTGYNDYLNNTINEVVGDTPENCYMLLKGFSAVWKRENIGIRLIYNKYEIFNNQYNSEAVNHLSSNNLGGWNVKTVNYSEGFERSIIYKDFEYGYNAFFKNSVDLFNVPVNSQSIYLRDNKFEIEEIYSNLNDEEFMQKSKNFDASKKHYSLETLKESNKLLNMAFVDKNNVCENLEEKDNADIVFYVKWKSKESSTSSFTINFTKIQEEYFNDFDMNETFDWDSSKLLFKGKGIDVNGPEIKGAFSGDKDSYKLTFTYQSSLLDKFDSYFNIYLDMLNGYEIKNNSSIALKDRNNPLFGAVGVINITGAYQASQISDLDYSLVYTSISCGAARDLEGTKAVTVLTDMFLNTYGDYEIDFEVGRVLESARIDVQGTVKYAFAPNLSKEFLGDPQNSKFDVLAYNKSSQYVKIVDKDFIVATDNNLDYKTMLFGYNPFEHIYIINNSLHNKKTEANPKNIQNTSIKLGDQYIGYDESVRFRFDIKDEFGDILKSKYFLYMVENTANGGKKVVLYECDKDGKKIIKILECEKSLQSSDLTLRFISNSSFGLLFSTDSEGVLFTSYGLNPNNKYYGKEIAPSKVQNNEQGASMNENPESISGDIDKVYELYMVNSTEIEIQDGDKLQKEFITNKIAMNFTNLYGLSNCTIEAISRYTAPVFDLQFLKSNESDGVEEFEFKAPKGKVIYEESQIGSEYITIKLNSEKGVKPSRYYEFNKNDNKPNEIVWDIEQLSRSEFELGMTLEHALDLDFTNNFNSNIQNCFIVESKTENEIRLKLNNIKLENGRYHVRVYCREIAYKIEYKPYLVDLDDVDKILKNGLPKVQGFSSENEVKTDLIINGTDKKQFFGNIRSDMSWAQEIKFYTKMQFSVDNIMASGKTNNGFKFYDWLFTTSNGSFFSDEKSKELNTFEFGYIFDNGNYTLGQNTVGKNTVLLTPIFIKRAAEFELGNYVEIEDLTGEKRKKIQEIGVDITLMNADGRGDFRYSYTDDYKPIFKMEFPESAINTNNYGYYLYGYKLINRNNQELISVNDGSAGTMEGEFKVTSSINIFEGNGNIIEYLENIEAKEPIEDTYYFIPILKRKTATIRFHSGTGESKIGDVVVGDGKKGVVYTNLGSSGMETTEKYFEMENKIYYGTVINLEEELRGRLKDKKSLSDEGILEDYIVKDLFFERIGYKNLYQNQWRSFQFNSADISSYIINLNAFYFSKTPYDDQKYHSEVSIVLDFYKAWEPIEYKIIFDSNKGEFENVMASDILLRTQYPVRIKYDLSFSEFQENIIPDMVYINSVKRTGYSLVGWGAYSTSGELETIFTIANGELELAVNENGENALFGDSKVYNKNASDSIVLAIWEANTYTVSINFNGANSVNGVDVLDDQLSYTMQYKIKYDTTFSDMFTDSVNRLSLSSILPNRLHFNFVGYYDFVNGKKYLIQDSTIFNYLIKGTKTFFDLETNHVSESLALTIYADWKLKETELDIKLNSYKLNSLTYKAEDQIVQIKDYFKAENVLTGKDTYDFTETDGIFGIILKNIDLTHIKMSIGMSSKTAKVNDKTLTFSVNKFGTYEVKMVITFEDDVINMNAGGLHKVELYFNINVDKANLSYIRHYGDGNSLNAMDLINVKRITSDLVTKSLKKKIASCITFADFVKVVKEENAYISDVSEKDVYNYVMLKYYYLTIYNNEIENGKYRNLTLQEYMESPELKDTERSLTIISKLDYFGVYDYKNLSKEQTIKDYYSPKIVSINVLNPEKELQITDVEIVSKLNLSANSSYPVRVYVKDKVFGAINNYDLKKNEKGYYIESGLAYILPQNLNINNISSLTSSYYSKSGGERSIEFIPETIKENSNQNIEGKIYYNIDENLYLNAELFVSNPGSREIDTTYDFFDKENYLYFNNLTVLLNNNGKMEDVTSSFKIVLNEKFKYKILNVMDVARINIFSKYLTKEYNSENKTEYFKFIDIDQAIANNLLKIVSVEYELDGIIYNETNLEGLNLGMFTKNDTVIYDISLNKGNHVSLFMNKMVKNITFSANTYISKYINLYKWMEKVEYKVDGTMAESDMFVFNTANIEYNNSGLTDVKYFAVYTDLVNIQLNYNFPEGYGDNIKSFALKFEESVQKDFVAPSDKNFYMQSMRYKDKSGNYKSYENLFTGRDNGRGATFLGIDPEQPSYKTVQIEVSWQLKPIELIQKLEHKKYRIGTFDKLYVTDIVKDSYIDNVVFEYRYEWYYLGQLLNDMKNDCLTIKNGGSPSDDGTYTLKVIAVLKPEFKNSIESKNFEVSDIVNFDLNFMKDKINGIGFPPASSLQKIYDGHNHISEIWYNVNLEFYDNDRDEYGAAIITKVYYSDIDAIYNLTVEKEGIVVREIKNAGTYKVGFKVNEEYCDVNPSLDLSLCEYNFVVLPKPVDIGNGKFDFDKNKKFNQEDPSFEQKLFIDTEEVTILLKRDLGEDVGSSYNIYLANVSSENGGNFILKKGEKVLFDSIKVTEEASKESLGLFTISQTGVLSMSYVPSKQNPKVFVVPYNKDGYTIEITDEFKLNIYSKGILFKSFSLELYDVSKDEKIIKKEILDIIKTKIKYLVPKFYASKDYDNVKDSFEYTYNVVAGEEFLKYFSSAMIPSEYKFSIGKNIIDTENLKGKFDKVYDGKDSLFVDLDGNVIEDTSTYQGVLIKGVYSDIHAKQVKVSLECFVKGTDEKLSNYELSQKIVNATISKMNANLNITLNKKQYVYGDISNKSLKDEILKISVTNMNGENIDSLLYDGYYKIGYQAVKANSEISADINKRGFFYKGDYDVVATGEFQDFNMTINKTSFTVNQMVYNKEILPGMIKVSVIDNLQKAYTETVTVDKTGDELNLEYVPAEDVGVSGALIEGVYDLKLLKDTYENGNILVKINDVNKGFEVLPITEVLYIKIEDLSIFDSEYDGKEISIEYDEARNSVIVKKDSQEISASRVSFYKKSSSGDKQNIENPRITTITFTNSSGEVIFKDAGTYNIIAKVESLDYNSIMFDSELKFVINQRMIEVSNIGIISKIYDGNNLFTINEFTEKVQGDNVSIFAEYDTKDSGSNKGITLQLEGVNANNYILSTNKLTNGKIEKAEAKVVLKDTDFEYGAITKTSGLDFSVSSQGKLLLPSEYDVELEILNAKYSLLGYLKVNINGEYTVQIKTSNSLNYNLSLDVDKIKVNPAILNIVFKEGDVYKVEFDTPESKEVEFKYTEYTSQLKEKVELMLKRAPGTEIGKYKILSAVSLNSDYKVGNVEDKTGFFEIVVPGEPLYLLKSEADKIVGNDIEEAITIAYEYNSIAYNNVIIKESVAGSGLYSLVLRVGDSETEALEYKLNFYTYNEVSNEYTKISYKVGNLTTNMNMATHTDIKSVGDYEIFSTDTNCPSYTVKIGAINKVFAYKISVKVRELYFKEEYIIKTFNNKNAIYEYEDISQIISGCLDSEKIGMKLTFIKGGKIGKYVGADYDIETELYGSDLNNYHLNKTISDNITIVKGAIARAKMQITISDQHFTYGDDINIQYRYTAFDNEKDKNSLDLSGYDLSRFKIKTIVDALDERYSTSKNLMVGEYTIIFEYETNKDFDIVSYVVNGREFKNCNAKVIIDSKKLTIQQKNDLPLIDVFTKLYDGNDLARIKDAKEELLFNLEGIKATSDGLKVDDVNILNAKYIKEMPGKDLNVEFELGGIDGNNYVLEPWKFGIIKPIILNINFDKNSEGDEIKSNVDLENLKTISQIEFPFKAKDYLTSNSAQRDTSSIKNFPSMLTGKRGYTFDYWSIDFDNVEVSNEKYNFLEELVNSLSLKNVYQNNVYSIRVGNNNKTLNLLEQLLNDENNIMGLSYKNNNSPSVTFKANWKANNYNLKLELQDDEGKKASLGKVLVDDNDSTTDDETVTKEYLKEFVFNTKIVLKATPLDSCKFDGFYDKNGVQYVGTEEGIKIYNKDGSYFLEISNIDKDYDIKIRFKVQKVNIVIDCSTYDKTIIESEDFLNVGNGKYQFKTNYINAKAMTFADLPFIQRSGYSVVSFNTSSTIKSKVEAKDFVSTTISSLLPVNEDKVLTLTLVPNFKGVSVVVTLDYGYDSKTKTLNIPYGDAYKSVEGWEETPERAGYKFLGWFKDQTKYTGEDLVKLTEAHTLVANWELGKFNVNIISNHAKISNATINLIYNNNEYKAKGIEYKQQFSFDVVADKGYKLPNNWTGVISAVKDPQSDKYRVTMEMGPSDLVYTIPVEALENLVTISGNNLGSISAYKVVLNNESGKEIESDLTVEGNVVKINSGETLRIKVSAAAGYMITDVVTFSNSEGLKIDKKIENDVLIITISGIVEHISIKFSSVVSLYYVDLSFDNNNYIDHIKYGDAEYRDLQNLDSFSIDAKTNFIFYVKYKYGYEFDKATSNEYQLDNQKISDGSYKGYHKIIANNVNIDGSIHITTKPERYTINVVVVSYNEQKELVDVAANKAFVNGVAETEADYNTEVTLSYEIEDTYFFAGWSKDRVKIFGNENNKQYKVAKTETIYAIFSTFKYNITFSTYEYFKVFTEYGDPSKVEERYNEVAGGRYFDSDTEKEISEIELNYGATKVVDYKISQGYKYYGYGYKNEKDEFVYISKNENINPIISIEISTLEFGDSLVDVKLYVVVESYTATLKIKSQLDIDGVREDDNLVGSLKLKSIADEDVNKYGYIDGTRNHYDSNSFVDGVLLNDKNFQVISYTGEVIRLEIKSVALGYEFLTVTSNDESISIVKISDLDNVYIYEISNYVGGYGSIEIYALFKPQLNIIDMTFINSNNEQMNGGVFDFKIDDQNKNKIWTSGSEYSSVVVSAYTGSYFDVEAYIRIGYSPNYEDIIVNCTNSIVDIENITYELLPLLDTGYVAKITFRVGDYIDYNKITITLTQSKYTINFKEAGKTLLTLNNVDFSGKIDLAETNTENIMIFDERIIYDSGFLKFDMQKENYNFEGFFTYENGAGVQYIDSNGEAVNLWNENGYIYNPATSKFELSQNARINPETNIIEVDLYLYWSYLKTRISFEFAPEIRTNYTAKDMIQGVDHTNSWFYETSPMYIEVAFNTKIEFVAPQINGFKFYKFIISQKSGSGEWLTDVVSFDEITAWMTNEIDRIVECNIKMVYFTKVDVKIIGGVAEYKINQEVEDNKAGELIKSGYVSTTKDFTIEAIVGEGYKFVRWFNTTYNISVFTPSMTLKVNRRTAFVLTVEGQKVTLDFGSYETKFGQILTTTVTSADNKSMIYRMGNYVGENFNKLFNTIDVKVGDKLEFALSVDYGFAVEWNLPEIVYNKFKDDKYYFTMNILPTNALQTIEIIPSFKNVIVSVYINNRFAENQILPNTVDENNVILAGSTLFNGQSVSNVSVERGNNIVIKTVVNPRYKISNIILYNYDNTFENMSEFYKNDEIILTNEYLLNNNIVGTIYVDIEYERIFWGDSALTINKLSGEGTDKSPYLIRNVEDLILFMEYVNSGKVNNHGIMYSECSYKVTEDIDLKDAFWTPIGTEDNPFNGTFNFDNHKITNIYTAFIYKTVSYNGLFGVLGLDAKIILSEASYWYIYLIVAIFILLVILLIWLIHEGIKRKRRLKDLSLK